MAIAAINNFRNIVKILSVKEEYGNALLAQPILCRTLLFIIILLIHTLIPAISHWMEQAAYPANIFHYAG